MTRIRKPQIVTRERLWPPIAQETAEQLIDNICGCAGEHDCNCVSVFNRARTEAWTRHNKGMI